MKALRLNTAIFVLWSMLTVLSGCTHKKPVLVAPQPIPPAAAPEPSPTPEPAQPAEPAQQPAQETQAPSPDQTKPETTQADKSKPQKPSPRKPARKVVDADKSEPTPTPAGQISPAPNTADTSHSQGSTEQLLKTAEANLNGVKRPL